MVTFLGPPENVPYHNSILYTALVTLFLFTRMLVNSTGFLHTHCPGAPHKSYTALIANNIFRTARVVDCLTDISFVKVLIREVSYPWTADAQDEFMVLMPLQSMALTSFMRCSNNMGALGLESKGVVRYTSF